MNQNLERARSLDLPLREETLLRANSVQQFWIRNRVLLEQAWKEWEGSQSISGLDESVIDKVLFQKINSAWNDPEREESLFEHLKEVSPGVFEFQFFNPQKIKSFRSSCSGARGKNTSSCALWNCFKPKWCDVGSKI